MRARQAKDRTESNSFPGLSGSLRTSPSLVRFGAGGIPKLNLLGSKHKGTAMSTMAIAKQWDWDQPIGRRSANQARLATVARSETPTVDEAIEAWLMSGAYARTTIHRVRSQLVSRRARGWRETHGIVTIDQFTAAAAADYIRYLWERGAAPATLRKVKRLLLRLAMFCAETPGYSGLLGDELQKLRLPKLVERIPEALTEDECLRMIAAAGSSLRNRLIAETFLLTGMRVSELCALTLEALHLESRPAYIHVRGSVHDPGRPKNSRERNIIVDYDAYGFGRGYVGRLRTYIAKERPASHYHELFLAERRETRTGAHTPLTIIGVQRLMTRIEKGSGVRCNPHRLRHTMCTRCADNDVPMFQLQEALGHSTLDMVRRYYSGSLQAMARGFYRAFGASNR
jgi:integrase/recombinase XerD